MTHWVPGPARPSVLVPPPALRRARRLQDFGNNYAGDSKVKIPWVRRDLCGARVLVMEWIDGMRCTNIRGIQTSGIDVNEFIRCGVVSGLRQLLEVRERTLAQRSVCRPLRYIQAGQKARACSVSAHVVRYLGHAMQALDLELRRQKGHLLVSMSNHIQRKRGGRSF